MTFPLTCVDNHYSLAAQVVNGTNYFFKLKIAASECIHLRVHVSLFGDKPKHVAMRKGEVAAGPLEYFEPP